MLYLFTCIICTIAYILNGVIAHSLASLGDVPSGEFLLATKVITFFAKLFFGISVTVAIFG